MKTWGISILLVGLVVAGASPLAWRAPDAASAVQFVEATSTAGLKFVHNSGRAGKKFLPETMGSGGAFVDLNGDGWLDVVLVNGKDWTPKGKRSFSAVYRNNGNGTFTDVTTASGFDVEMYGMGVAAGDYDNDGRDDLYVTTLEGDRLFHNEGNFKFRDVTKSSGIVNAHFGTSAAWLDYDRDGKLDVFVANYVQWTAAADVYCSLDGTNKSYCTPESYKGTPSKLFHNLGAGKFEDVTGKAGVGDPTSKSLGIAVLDYDGDGWPDIFVANDTQPNKLYRNNGNGTFTEKGVAAGVAFSEDGVARGAMGADAADYDRSGRPHLLVGNFANQMLALYRNEGNGLFVDEAPSSTVGRASLLSLAFGVFFFDYDLDGQQDIFAVNGHIEEEIARVQPKVLYKQIPLMFRNLGKGRFDSVGASLGAAFNVPQVGRGAAYGDYDRDGDLDILLINNQGPARLLRNDGGNKNHWLTIRTVGTKANRDGIGAQIKVKVGGRTLVAEVRSGSSYNSNSDMRPHFGLGQADKVDWVEVRWPSGLSERYVSLSSDAIHVLKEGSGAPNVDKKPPS